MKPFEYSAPTSIVEAVGALKKGSVAPLAGGTDLLAQIRADRKRPQEVLDVKLIPELMRVEWGSETVTIGAAVPCYQLYEDDRFARAFPVIVDAVTIIGGIQIQSRASLGGNLCNSSPSADGVCPLIVLNSRAIIAGSSGERSVAVSQFCTGPGTNVLKDDELLVKFEIPRSAENWGAAYQRFIPRNEMDIAVAGVAVAVRTTHDGVFEQARIALAGVAPTPKVAEEAQQYLAGKPAGEDVINEAAEIAAKAASPISDMRGTAKQRRQLVKVLTARMLRKALERYNPSEMGAE